MPNSIYPLCNTYVDKFELQCDMCHYWVHYSCTNLPPYAIKQLSKSTRLLSYLTCVHERYKNDFPELHTEIEGAIKFQNDALHLPVVSEIAVTPIEAAPPSHTICTPIYATSISTPTSETSSPTPTVSLPSPTHSASRRTPTHPTISIPSSTATSPSNKPVGNYSPSQAARSTKVSPPCKLYMRGHCQYGKQC